MSAQQRTLGEGSSTASGTQRPSENDVISDLRRAYDELTQSQKRIAEAIVEDPEFVAFATVDKMAARLGVSPSTVVRFAYRLGLDGYQDLQDRVRTLVRAQMRLNAATGNEANDLTAHLGDSVFARSLAHDLENLRRTTVNLQLEELERAVRLIVEARRVYVLGGATSHAIAVYASLALDRMRGDTILVDREAFAASGLLSMTSEDTFLVFTFAPYASSTLRITNTARSRGARIIAISDTPVSPVGQRVDVVLPALASGLSAQNSIVAPLAVTTALLNGVIAASPNAMKRYGEIVGIMNEWDVYVLKGDDGA
jgi:DNA-binding MurR/RpiR family transcriptional regulator